MNEKVTHEIRIIETEDGFRVELKGDKEELRRLMFGGGWGNLRQFFGNFGFGPRGFNPRGFGRPGFGHHQHGPNHEEREMPRHGRKRHHYDLGPWWDENTPSENA